MFANSDLFNVFRLALTPRQISLFNFFRLALTPRQISFLFRLALTPRDILLEISFLGYVAITVPSQELVLTNVLHLYSLFSLYVRVNTS